MLSLVARDPDKGDSIYSEGDLIAVTFNQATNRANLPEQAVSKAQIDRLFQFSHSLGADYSGHWPNSSTFIITVLDATGNGEPIMDSFFVTTLEEGRLRDAYAVSEAAVISGNRNQTILTLSNVGYRFKVSNMVGHTPNGPSRLVHPLLSSAAYGPTARYGRAC